MKRSDALPPARSCKQGPTSQGLEIVLALLFILCLPWLTGCAATNPNAAAQTSGHSLTVTGTLPAAKVGVAVNTSLSATGGKAPYTFSLASGTLPSGLSLGPNSGTISGTPSAAGDFTFEAQAIDATGMKGTNSFQITVASSSGIGVSVTPGSTTVASQGTVQFTATVTNTSNVGVTWTTSNGTIDGSGFYQAPKISVDATATVTATSTADPKKSGQATLTITTGVQPPTLTIETTSLPGASSGSSYSDTLQAAGGITPYHWAVSSGTLPSGLKLQSDGVLSGTPTQTGQFSFTLQASDSSSPQETATKSLSLTVSTSTSGGATIPKTFFSAGFNGAKVWPPTDGLGQTATLGGIRLWDDGVKWGMINTANGVYNWGGLDAWLDRAASAGTDVLYTFGYTPQFAASSIPAGVCVNQSTFSCAPPKDVNPDGTGTDAYFQAFVTALVNHAAGRIAYYELWNEPDCNCFWDGTTAQLVRMSKDAAAIIRSLDPNAKILSPSAHGPTMATWFDGYVAAGGASYFDIVNVHMRGQNGTNQNPEAFLTVWGQVQSEVQKRGLTKLPIWDDEHGILKGQGLTDPDLLAGYVAQSLILRAGVGIQRQYIYTWDSPVPYGMQGNQSGTAWDQVANWLIGHTISACTAAGTVYTCNLDNGQIVWDTAQSCSNGVCGTSNYRYPTQYTWYKDMASSSQFGLSGGTVPIGYKPILLTKQ